MLGKVRKIKFRDTLYPFGFSESDSFLICQEVIDSKENNILVRCFLNDSSQNPVHSVYKHFWGARHTQDFK